MFALLDAIVIVFNALCNFEIRAGTVVPQCNNACKCKEGQFYCTMVKSVKIVFGKREEQVRGDFWQIALLLTNIKSKMQILIYKLCWPIN